MSKSFYSFDTYEKTYAIVRKTSDINYLLSSWGEINKFSDHFLLQT